MIVHNHQSEHARDGITYNDGEREENKENKLADL